MKPTLLALLAATSMSFASQEKARPIEGPPSTETFYAPRATVEAALTEFAASPKRRAVSGYHRIADGGPHAERTFADLYPGVASPEALAKAREEYRQNGTLPDATWVHYWMSKSDAEIFAMISPENPRALVPNYHSGHPLWAGNLQALIPIWGKPNRFHSPRDGMEWGPGVEVTNPGTGEPVTVEDPGTGWRPPEGFATQTPFKFVAAYRTYLIRKLIYYPYNGEHGFDGPDYRQHGSPLYALAYAYAVTGEQKYADRVLLILATLAQYYSQYTSLDDTGVGWHWYPQRGYVDDHNFENGMILNMALAYDLVWDALPDAKNSLTFLRQQGVELATPQDLGEEIEGKLFAYCWEFVKRAIRGSTGNTLFRQMQAALVLGNVFGNDTIMEYVLDGPKSLNYSVPGSFYRDGRFWEDSCTYCWVVDHAFADSFGQITHYRSDRYPDGLQLHPAVTSTFHALKTRLDDWQVSGRLFGIGDSKIFRSPILRASAPFLTSWTAHETGLTLLRTEAGKENGSAALLYHGNAGNGHGHLHQLMLKIYGEGYDFSGDLGYPANFTHTKWTEWTRGTLSHPTVVVDRASQNVGTTASLSLFAQTPWAAVASAFSNNVYQPGAARDVNGRTPSPRLLAAGATIPVPTYHRSAILLEVAPGRQVVVDLFRVTGGTSHDLPFHAPAGDDAQFFEIEGATAGTPLPGTLAGANIPYGERDHEGYSYLKEATPLETEGAFHATWRPEGPGGPGYRVSLPASFPGKALLAKGEGEGPPGLSPWDRYLLLRHEGAAPLTTHFVAVHETFASQPLDFEVRSEPLAGYPPGQMAIKVTLQLKEGTPWVIESALDGSPSRYEHRGREQVKISGPRGTLAVNWPTEGTKAAPWIAEVKAVDYDANEVTVHCTHDLGQMKGQRIAFQHPAYTKAATFEIASVRAAGPESWVLTLEQHPIIARTRIRQMAKSRELLSVDRVSEKLIVAATLFDGKAVAINGTLLPQRMAYADISSVLIRDGYQKFRFDAPLPDGLGKEGEVVTVYDYGVGDEALFQHVTTP